LPRTSLGTSNPKTNCQHHLSHDILTEVTSSSNPKEVLLEQEIQKAIAMPKQSVLKTRSKRAVALPGNDMDSLQSEQRINIEETGKTAFEDYCEVSEINGSAAG